MGMKDGLPYERDWLVRLIDKLLFMLPPPPDDCNEMEFRHQTVQVVALLRSTRSRAVAYRYPPIDWRERRMIHRPRCVGYKTSKATMWYNAAAAAVDHYYTGTDVILDAMENYNLL